MWTMYFNYNSHKKIQKQNVLKEAAALQQPTDETQNKNAIHAEVDIFIFNL